jgi:hypothetical protein
LASTWKTFQLCSNFFNTNVSSPHFSRPQIHLSSTPTHATHAPPFCFGFHNRSLAPLFPQAMIFIGGTPISSMKTSRSNYNPNTISPMSSSSSTSLTEHHSGASLQSVLVLSPPLRFPNLLVAAVGVPTGNSAFGLLFQTVIYGGLFSRSVSQDSIGRTNFFDPFPIVFRFYLCRLFWSLSWIASPLFCVVMFDVNFPFPFFLWTLFFIF